MTFLGCIPPNPFDVPLAEAIPLADQPHLLQVRLTLPDPQDAYRKAERVKDTGSTSYMHGTVVDVLELLPVARELFIYTLLT